MLPWITVWFPLALPADEVHVWFADPAELAEPARARAAAALLSPDEVERWQRFVFERDRVIYLAAHALVRTALSRYEAELPRGWQFSIGEHGRPEIARPATSLRFNLSHTHGMVACAVVRDADVGVDVELISREAPLEVADRFFAPAEVAALRALAPADQPRRFFDYWTLKESYIKARGLGLALPLGQFAIELSAGRPPGLAIEPQLGDDGALWQLAQHAPGADHLLGLCVRRPRPGAELAVRWQRAPL